MNYNIITIFPDLIEAFSDTGFIKRSVKNNIISINIINLEYSANKHKRRMIKLGGGPERDAVLLYPMQRNIKDSSIIYLSFKVSLPTQAEEAGI